MNDGKIKFFYRFKKKKNCFIFMDFFAELFTLQMYIFVASFESKGCYRFELMDIRFCWPFLSFPILVDFWSSDL